MLTDPQTGMQFLIRARLDHDGSNLIFDVEHARQLRGWALGKFRAQRGKSRPFLAICPSRRPREPTPPAQGLAQHRPTRAAINSGSKPMPAPMAGTATAPCNRLSERDIERLLGRGRTVAFRGAGSRVSATGRTRSPARRAGCPSASIRAGITIPAKPARSPYRSRRCRSSSTTIRRLRALTEKPVPTFSERAPATFP